MKQFKRAMVMILMLASFMVPVTAAQDATPAATPVAGPGLQEAVTWLIGQQQEDGSWLGYSGEPDAGTTVDAIIALAAAGESGIDTGDSIERAVKWLDESEAGLVYAQQGTGQAAKITLALIAADVDTLEVGGIQPFELVKHGFNGDSGLYGGGLYDHAYVLMAFAATGTDVPAEAISVLETMQAENGGFSWDGSTEEANVDSNTTAMIVQALVAVGEGDSAIVASAMDFLRLTITDQGAAYSIGAEADANSTALVAQALLATDQDASVLIAHLPSFQNANGAFFWMRADVTDNLFSTIQAIPAAAEQVLPVVPGLDEMEEAA